MLLPTTLSLAMFASLSFEDIPKPAVATVDITSSDEREHPWDLVEAKDGSFYVLRNQPNSWPTVMIDRYDAAGTKQWTHNHEIYRTPAGAGFKYISATAVDDQGHLYFAYDTHLNGHGSFLVKMDADHEVKWEVRLEKCLGIRQIQPTRKFNTHDVTAVCGTNSGTTQLTRVAGSDGARLSRTRVDPDGVSERMHQAAQTKTDQTYVVVHWNGSHTTDHRRGTAVYKFDAAGEKQWRRSWEYPSPSQSGPRPKAIAAYPDREGGVLAVFAIVHDDAIEVHKYDPAGNRVGKHVIETGGKTLTDDSTITTEHNWINDEITIAWDDKRNDDHLATTLGVAVIDFDRRPRATDKKGGKPPVSASQVKPTLWKGRVERQTWIEAGDHDELVDVEVGDDGAIHLAAVDHDGSSDYIRITRLSKFANAGYASIRFRRRTGHARPTHLLRSSNRLHVLGIEDAAAGDFISYQADVLRLVLWTDGSKVITAKPHSKMPVKKTATKKTATKATKTSAGRVPSRATRR